MGTSPYPQGAPFLLPAPTRVATPGCCWAVGCAPEGTPARSGAPSPAGSADPARGGKTREAPGRACFSTLVSWAAREPPSAPAGQGCPRGGGGGGCCATEAGPSRRKKRAAPAESLHAPGAGQDARRRPSPAGPGGLLGVVVRASDGRAEPGCRLGGQARARDRTGGEGGGEGAGEGLLQRRRRVVRVPGTRRPLAPRRRPCPAGTRRASACLGPYSAGRGRKASTTCAGARLSWLRGSGVGGWLPGPEGPLPQARRRGWESGRGRPGPLMRRGGAALPAC